MITIADLKQITISVTSQCNLNCAWCFKDASHRGRDLLTFQDVSVLLDTVSGFAHGITLTGGEPFVRRDIEEILLKALSLPFTEIAITTNGLAIGRRLEPILRNDRIVLGISIDGDQSSHDAVRGRGTFSATVSRVRQLTSLGINIVLVMTVSRKNLFSVGTVMELASDIGVIGVSFQRLRCQGRGQEFQHHRLDAVELQALALEIQSARKRFNGVFIDFKDPLRNVLNHDFLRQYRAFSGCAICGGCHAGVSYVYICEDGGIQPCAFLAIRLGNVLEDDLVEIWERSEVLEKIRTRGCYKVCKDCELWHVCRGCRADAYTSTGDYMEGDPLCFAKTPMEREVRHG